MRSTNKKTKTPAKVLAIRVICIVIALLMLVAVLVSAAISANATDQVSYSPFKDGDSLIRVGIYYSDEVEDSFRVRCSAEELGHRLFATKGLETSYIFTLDGYPTVSFCVDGNLSSSKSGSIYSYARDTEDIVYGEYRIKFNTEYSTETELLQAIKSFAEISNEVTFTPAYLYGKYYVLAGNFSELSLAEEKCLEYSELFGIDTGIHSSSSSSIIVLNNVDAKPLFVYDMGGEFGLGCYPIQNTSNSNYVKLDSGYYRPDITEFKRFNNGTYDGLAVVMIAEMQNYIKSVVPYEIYTTWPMETIKAFSITARTYAYANLTKHMSKYGFSICSTSCCQVSRGFSRLNDRVSDAVDATKNMVLACDGELITSYYSALGGGCMAAGHQVWNQAELSYLQGHYTPWEDCDAHSYGSWSFSASPSELCDYLNSKGYTTLKDKIADIEITELCENSSYVYAVKITDMHGNAVNVSRTRNVKNAFGAYLYSGNFVIMHNGKTETGLDEDAINGIYVVTGNGINVIKNETTLNVITLDGIKTTTLPNILSVNSSNDMVSCDVITEAKEFISATHDLGDVPESDFVFIGSGSGHGVGMSQAGAKDLGNLGYVFEQILTTYFPGTEILTYSILNS